MRIEDLVNSTYRLSSSFDFTTMKQFLFIAFLAFGLPLSFASYGPPAGGPDYSLGGSAHSAGGHGYAGEGGIQEFVNAAGHSATAPSAASIDASGDHLSSHADIARIQQIQAQFQAINSNAAIQNYQNSEAIAESLAEHNLANNIRSGHVNVVAPNSVDQAAYRSLLVPSGRNTQVITTNPLPSVVVHQPGSPPVHVNSGPAAVIRSSPVIYKIKPSVIYQHEVINKVPTPLNLNPVYVKVFKSGRAIDAPISPVVKAHYETPSYVPPQPEPYEPAHAPPSYDGPPAYSGPAPGDGYGPAPSPY